MKKLTRQLTEMIELIQTMASNGQIEPIKLKRSLDLITDLIRLIGMLGLIETINLVVQNESTG